MHARRDAVRLASRATRCPAAQPTRSTRPPRQQHVGALQVQVHDAAGVQVDQRARDVQGHPAAVAPPGDALGRQVVHQVAAIHVFCDQQQAAVGLAARALRVGAAPGTGAGGGRRLAARACRL